MISKIWIKVWGKASGLFGSKSLWLAFSFWRTKATIKSRFEAYTTHAAPQYLLLVAMECGVQLFPKIIRIAKCYVHTGSIFSLPALNRHARSLLPVRAAAPSPTGRSLVLPMPPYPAPSHLRWHAMDRSPCCPVPPPTSSPHLHR